MRRPNEVIAENRARAADAWARVLPDIMGMSELQCSERIAKELSAERRFYQTGWYDPPPGGNAVLIDTRPFERLQFETLRNPESWPIDSAIFNPKSVGIFYASPVELKSRLFGDIGFTIYKGNDKAIQEHLRKTLVSVIAVAERAEVDMKFLDLYDWAMNYFQKDLSKVIAWMTTTHDPMKVNLGHTVPGSLVDDVLPDGSFGEIREAIRTKRIYINGAEQFKIPETCAFTVEARLADINDATLPNTFFHIIVTFSEGKKEILTNFAAIFNATGMAEYMHL